jgi:hypothetical protein
MTSGTSSSIKNIKVRPLKVEGRGVTDLQELVEAKVLATGANAQRGTFDELVPTSRLFGRITHKMTHKKSKKSRATGQICRRIVADSVQRGPKKRPNFLKSLFSSLILCN